MEIVYILAKVGVFVLVLSISIYIYAIACAIVIAPIVLRAIYASKNIAGKLFSLVVIILLTVLWLLLRGQAVFFGNQPLLNTEFVWMDLLIASAWLVLALSLFVWPGWVRKKRLELSDRASEWPNEQ